MNPEQVNTKWLVTLGRKIFNLPLLGVVSILLAIVFIYSQYNVQPIINEKDGAKPCTMEAKICPDGTTVGRTGPNCEFAPCPSEKIYCPRDIKKCPGGVIVGRIPPDCEFRPCPLTDDFIEGSFVNFDELISNPERYNGKKIRTKGIWLTGFEVSALGESIEYEEGEPVRLRKPTIWLSASAVVNKTNCSSLKNEQAYPQFSYCSVEVEGIFEYGSSYGHLGGYNYRISPLESGVAETKESEVEPEDSTTAGLAAYPDLPLNSIPSYPISTKFLVEHRTALDEGTVTVEGIVVKYLSPEEACPKCTGERCPRLCGAPYVTIADSIIPNRDTNYDLRIILPSIFEGGYTTGEKVTIPIRISASKTDVVGQIVI